MKANMTYITLAALALSCGFAAAGVPRILISPEFDICDHGVVWIDNRFYRAFEIPFGSTRISAHDLASSEYVPDDVWFPDERIDLYRSPWPIQGTWTLAPRNVTAEVIQTSPEIVIRLRPWRWREPAPENQQESEP